MGEPSMPQTNHQLDPEEEPGKENIVVTGFGLFSGHKVNSSWEAVKELQKGGLGEKYKNYRIIADRLEVEYKYIDDHVPKLWKQYRPKIMIHCGLSAIAKEVTLEQLAHRNGYETKDARGCNAVHQCCCPSGDDIVKTSLRIGEICNAVNNSNCGVTAVISSDPGRFLCDYTYYKSLSIDRSRTIFVHVPPLDSPYSVKELALAMRVIVLAMLEQIDEKHFNEDLQSLQIRASS